MLEKREELKTKDTAIVRIEQIAPFPYQEVEKQFNLYPNAEICWAQEEHRNQGAWSYVRERLEFLLERTKRRQHEITYIGRRISGSTAVGSLNTHKIQLQEFLEDAFNTGAPLN